MNSPHQPRKRFGQNFLHEAGVIQRIINALQLQTDDHVVEIGPGEGALTGPMLAQLPQLHAIELDRDLVPRLHAQFGQHGLSVHQGDALRFDFAQLAQQLGGKLRIIGNLPYNISTPLLFHLLAHSQQIQDMHIMVQLEVAERLVAMPGSPAYGRLSVAVAAHASANLLFKVAPGAFRPPPKVHSAVVRLRPRPPNFALHDPELFAELLRCAFSARRKTLSNALRKQLTGEQIMALDIDPKRRPDTLSAAEYASLANYLSQSQP